MSRIAVYVILAIFHPLVHAATFSIPNKNNNLYVRSHAGNFLGYGGTSYSGKFFASFSGIRYARAPVGELSYQDPAPFEYDQDCLILAKDEAPDCLQFFLQSNQILGEEDCLFLNIYSPNITGEAPVIIYIFGGAYLSGSSSRQSYGPEYFMDENIVLVIANYRLGALGYASTEDKVLPGNLGQKDQAEVILWVSRNIKHFGGDPDNLTLMGHSSGAVSSEFHALTPGVKHLIKRLIAHSGSTLAPWAASHDHLVRNKTLLLTSLLGCQNESLDAFDCLRRTRGRTIVGRENETLSDVYDIIPFRPVYNEIANYAIDVPLLTGFLETEEALFCNMWAEQLGTTIPEMILENKPHFASFLIKVLELNPETSPFALEPLASAMADFYWGGNNDTSYSYNNVLSVLQAISDIMITYPVYRQAQITRGDLYTYFFNYNPSLKVESSPYYGTTHTDELKYFFPSRKIDIRSSGSESDRQMSMDLVKIWVNFASGRNPIPNLEWNGTSNRGGYLEISNSGFNLVDVKNENTEMAKRLKFWANLLHEQIGKA